ncbi:DUF7144 family membrane protein [Microbacterium rhizomatis]|uniref:DUF7144 domain-containing protein n=1 Tax=Microbacterium rhizomatis TaxID=1631477 RepID=A0A5J5J4Z6_9MICO|nr:hypothetical protein [Microbacterium rhizomatis]KAA9108403.1 hypothetical protein F6B43_13575 [Microbacterium rhizomatis]
MAGTRPGGVTVVSILAWISGLLQLITGILALFVAPTSSAIMVAAWIAIVLGVITILVGAGLWRGSSVARLIATVVFVLNLVNAVFTIFATPANAWSATVNGLFALIGIILLWTKAASDFFRR